jgi:hypothetical protein
MRPEERAEAAYSRWISQLSEDLRGALESDPYQRELFIEIIAASLADAQEEVALGVGSAELPYHADRSAA